MKRLLWQLPAVIGGTAALTFFGVSALQAAMNEPLQEHGAIVRAERAVASAQARQAAAEARTARASATASGGVRGATATEAVPCAEACGDPSTVMPRPVVGSQPPVATTPAEVSSRAAGEADASATPAAGPGKGGGAGRSSAPGQNRDADGRPAKANGAPQSGKSQNPGKGQGVGKGQGAGNSRSNGKSKSNGKGQGAGKSPNTATARIGLGPVAIPAIPGTPEAGRRLDVVLRLPAVPGTGGTSGPVDGHGR